MMKKLLIAATLLASTSAFAQSYSFSGLIDPDAQPNFNAGTFASLNVNTSTIAANSVFDLSGTVSINYLTNAANNKNRFITNLSLFDGFTDTIIQSPTSNNGVYSYNFLNLSSAKTYQLRFNINSGSYNGASSTDVLRNLSGSYQVTQGMIATPVPEPESYAMMFAGVLLMGVIALRRQKN